MAKHSWLVVSILFVSLSLMANQGAQSNNQTNTQTAQAQKEGQQNDVKAEQKPTVQNKRKPTLNRLPGGRCQLKRPLQIPDTQIHLSEFQIFTGVTWDKCRSGLAGEAGLTSLRGLVGVAAALWKECYTHEARSAPVPEPLTEVVIRYLDPRDYRRRYHLILNMEKEVERRAFVDRHGNYLAFYETTSRENVNIEQDVVHIVAKRQILKANENKMIAELQIFKPGDKEKGIKSKLLHRERCLIEFTDRNF